jgi:U3 small nucleolar RNA-associated protein 19
MAPPTSSSAETAAQIKNLLKEVADPKADVVRLDELRKLFGRLIEAGELQLGTSTSESSTVKQKWSAFLQASHKRMVSQLGKRVVEGKRAVIRTFWGVIATSPVWSFNRQYKLLSEPLLRQWIRAMSQVPVMDKSVRHMVEVEFLGSFRDAQYYTMIAIRECANELMQGKLADIEERAERLVQILSMIPIPSSQEELDDSANYLFTPPVDGVPDQEEEQASDSESDEDDEEDDNASNSASEDDGESLEEEISEPTEPLRKKQKTETSTKRFAYQLVRSHHRMWAKAWLAVLRLPLPVSALKHALQFLPQRVLSNVAHPLEFSDFFMSAYNNTGVLPVFALQGLFVLMIEHGLEYKDFYKQLYHLITPSLFYVKYRTRFFILLDKCLSRNDMLPAHVVAAFCKRLVRCALQGPPSSILFVLALVSNLIRKHAEVACLIHRSAGEIEDKFDAATDDPELANALQSSLWEMQVLENHYFVPVVTLAKSLGRKEELKAPLYQLDDFLGHTYQSLVDQERKRKKGKTPLTFQEPKSLFTKNDVFAGILSIGTTMEASEEDE